MRTLTFYRQPDGSWSLDDESGGAPVVAELAEGWKAVKGLAGQPRVLSVRPNELGMTIEQAIERGVARLLDGKAAEFERVTLTDLKAVPNRLAKPR
ncbi:MAG TPA: hypothetical protein VF881_19105 [Polyangiaceae bacterium]